MKTIGLLSGTFDPIHDGHLALALAAREQLGLDGVWILVNADPPRKTGVTPFAHRLAMATLAVSEVPGVVADREPVQRHPHRHSIATARQLVADYPDASFTLLMGMDIFVTVDRWEDHEELCKLMDFGVVARPESSLGKSVSKVNTMLHFGTVSAGGISPRHRLINMPPLTVSSTRVQREVRAGQTAHTPPAVQAYIREHRLYLEAARQSQ